MTKENCLKLLKEYKERDMSLAYEDMKKHILTSRKFENDPIIDELQEAPIKSKKVK